MAITPVFVCGTECGVIAAGSHLVAGAGSPSFDTTNPRTGLNALRFNPAGAQWYVRLDQNYNLATRIFVLRFYIRFATLPSIDTDLCVIENSLASLEVGVAFKQSTGTMECFFAVGVGTLNFAGGGVAVQTGRWYLVDYMVRTDANPWTVVAQIDGVPITGSSIVAVAANPATFALGTYGITAAGTADVNYDDLIGSQTIADYPIGPGHVEAVVPNADGTHTSTTSDIVKGTIATPVGANVAGATDTFNWVNAKPLLGGATDNTRLINQQTVDTGYAEWQLEDHTAGVHNSGPRAVDVIGADREASTATCNFQLKINDNGTEAVVSNRGTVAGVITDRYFRAIFVTAPSTAAAWTNTLFNGLRIRFGYSSDATPDVYCRGVMVEAEWPEEAPVGVWNTEPERYSGLHSTLLRY